MDTRDYEYHEPTGTSITVMSLPTVWLYNYPIDSNVRAMVDGIPVGLTGTMK